MDYKSVHQGLQNGAAFRDYKSGQKRLQIGAGSEVTKRGKRIKYWGRDYRTGQKDHKSGQRLQIGREQHPTFKFKSLELISSI